MCPCSSDVSPWPWPWGLVGPWFGPWSLKSKNDKMNSKLLLVFISLIAAILSTPVLDFCCCFFGSISTSTGRY